MNITLDSHPSDAPCCLKITADDGRDILIQTDWDHPSVASSFGFSLRSVQKCDQCGKVSTGLHNAVVKYCRHCPDAVGNKGTNVGVVCNHNSTDGTIDCPDCSMPASKFIQAAGQWLDDNDGAIAEDPGYFS